MVVSNERAERLARASASFCRNASWRSLVEEASSMIIASFGPTGVCKIVDCSLSLQAPGSSIRDFVTYENPEPICGLGYRVVSDSYVRKTLLDVPHGEHAFRSADPQVPHHSGRSITQHRPQELAADFEREDGLLLGHASGDSTSIQDFIDVPITPQDRQGAVVDIPLPDSPDVLNEALWEAQGPVYSVKNSPSAAVPGTRERRVRLFSGKVSGVRAIKLHGRTVILVGQV